MGLGFVFIEKKNCILHIPGTNLPMSEHAVRYVADVPIPLTLTSPEGRKSNSLKILNKIWFIVMKSYKTIIIHSKIVKIMVFRI